MHKSTCVDISRTKYTSAVMEGQLMGVYVTILARWIIFLGVAVQAITHEEAARSPANYRDCSVGKGLARLYNCGRIFDSNGSGIVQLENFTTPDRYLIRLRISESLKTVNTICDRAASRKRDTYFGTCIYKYTTVWVGMLMLINGGNLSMLITKEAPYVEYVEVDGIVRVSGSTVQGGPPSWGLDRIDHLPGQDLINGLYTSTASGTGVHVYIVDTGIRCSHREFQFLDGRLNGTTGLPLVRCVAGFDGINDGYGVSDCNGHGTHVAGIVGGLTTGVAKDAFLHPVRVLGCDGSGTFGSVIAGLEWVAGNLLRPAVLLLSVSTKASISVDQAVLNVMKLTGAVAIAAAGNFMQETCNYSPARVASVVTVGSTNILNEMSWFSNYGPCTTLFAPGESVYSAYIQTDCNYTTLSGTSMACPFVGGAAALYLSENALASPEDVRQNLIDSTESTAVSWTNLKPGTTTRLLNTNKKQKFYSISPRHFYNATENSTYIVTVSLLLRPATTVFLTPVIDSSIGYFVPKLLLFPADARWSYPQSINLVLPPASDFLDHYATIQWIFSSRDTRFVASPEGSVTVQDTDVCKQTANNNCGQTFDNPKLIPSLPFHYLDDSSRYQDMYNENFDAVCHARGPDLLFQYTPTEDTLVNISLCGPTTQFDTILSVYEYKVSVKDNLTRVSCNDDYCGAKSMLTNIQMLARHVYIIMVDGYRGGGGPLEFYMNGPGSPVMPSTDALPTSISVMISSFSSRGHVSPSMCTNWRGFSCQPAPTPLPIQAEFFWSPVRWEPCGKHCGGGYQQAVMHCFTGNYSKVDDWNCASLPSPVVYKVCNLIACNNYTIFEGPWNECSQTCGGGIQKRQVTCMDNMGNTAHPDRCGGENEFDNLQSCNLQPCNDSLWKTGSWDYCNVPCGGGRRYRDVVCSFSGLIVDEGMCDPLVTPPAELVCNSHPCQTYAWLVGPWEECPSGCKATKYRSVQCVDGWGEVILDSFCSARMKPANVTACQQPSVVCDICSYNNCSNNGLCKNGVCSCFDKWTGTYCEKPKVCKGNPMGVFRDGIVGCCPFGTIDLQQQCCLVPGATIDVNGACCNGSLDACGICNGPHISVDSQNQCCPSVRDEKGVCCRSGKLDECHICDGDGTTCATNVSILALLDDSLDVTKNQSVDWKGFMLRFMTKVASRLNVAAEGLVLTGVQTMYTLTGDCSTMDEMKLGCLGTGTTELLAVFNFSVLPIPSKSLTFMSIEEADITNNLVSLDDNSNGELILGLKIKAVERVARAGLCGNGFCERGERCGRNGKSSTADGPCCPADCPYVPVGCPITLQGPRKHLPCSKNGICLDASGQCSCFSGYQGDACDKCLIGFSELPDGRCMKVPGASLMKNLTLLFLNTTGKNTNGNPGTPPGAGGSGGSPIGTVLLVLIVGGLVYLLWRNYGQNFAASPFAQGALQTLGLGTATGSQDRGDPPEGNGTSTQSAPVETESPDENSRKQLRRSSLKEERREALEERRKSRSFGPENSSTRKSLMMTPDDFASGGERKPPNLTNFFPAPASAQGQGGTPGDFTKKQVSDQSSRMTQSNPQISTANYGNYTSADDFSSRGNFTLNDSSECLNDDDGFRPFSGQEEQDYQGYASSSNNFFTGSRDSSSKAPNTPGGGPAAPPSNSFFGGGSNLPSSVKFFGAGWKAPTATNFFGGGPPSSPGSDLR